MQPYNFNIKKIPLDDIIVYDKQKYNSNNHWSDNMKPNDYFDKISNGYTSKWIHIFKPKYKTIVLNNKTDLKWMKNANKIGMQTGKFSELFQDELEETVNRLNKEHKRIFDGTEYFIRTENVSLKYGQHGIGPYKNIKSIIESIVSCIAGHTPIYSDTTEIIIYLIPWTKINDENEFRVFVHKNKITAISQQNIYKKLYDDISLDKLNAIVTYFESNIKDKIKWTDSYTYDFVFIKNDDILEPYFIELNSFGKEYAAGSALFHWLLDENKLYGIDHNIIYVRFTC